MGRGRRLRFVAALAAVAALIAPAATPASRRSETVRSTLEAGVLRQLNHVRAVHRLPALRLNPLLTEAAAQHSREMAEDGYFEHASHNGRAFWRRISTWYRSSGYSYWSVGENLLWSSPSVDPQNALRLWMASPEHRANILDGRWREIGVAAVHVDHATGMYQGRAVTVITTDFGARR